MTSKIKVDTIENVSGSGNVSLGSGHNLVVPGDLTVDTSTLKVDASNNRVGIGTTAPVRDLGIGIHGTSTGPEIAIGSTTTGFGSVLFGDGATGTDAYRGYLQYQHNGDYMLIGASAAEKMRIRGSGAVTMPDQVGFFANGSPSQTSQYLHTFTNVRYNNGSHYNNSTGIFTAPVAGVYQISGAYRITGNTAGNLMAIINGSDDVGAEDSIEDNYSTISLCCSYKLAANDTVRLYATTTPSSSTPRNYFSVHLLG